MSAPVVKRRKLSPAPDGASGANGSKMAAAVVSRNGHGSKHNEQKRQSKTQSDPAELAAATGLYKSSFFKLQLDELLSELKPNYDKQVSNLQGTLHSLKRAIEEIPDRPAKSVAEAEKELRTAHNVVVPFPEPHPAKDTKYTLSYARPTNINVVGSFALRTGARTTDHYTVDLAVTMPSTLFQDKDYVNYRYFHKRAFYIACIAAALRDAKDLGLQMSFAQQDGDSLRPVILLQPEGMANSETSRSKYRIRILTAVDESLFPVARTLPAKNNIRQHSSTGAPLPDDGQNATPFYNAALRSEATVALYHKHLHSMTKRSDSFRDACILGRTWLRQRGFSSSFQNGGFGGFEWAAVMSLLFEGGGPNGKPVLFSSYSSYQLFKATIQFLAGKNLMDPLSLFATGIAFPPGGPSLYDGKRGLNILYKMTASSYSVLHHEAAVTLKMLNESRQDHFERVFILKVDEPMLRFDRLISVPFPHGLDTLQAIRLRSALHGALNRALGDRVKLISLTGHCMASWPVTARASQDKPSKILNVGLILDSDNASRVVDHGPSAEEKEDAASFRSFWGDKAELRRFKDGGIFESLVWSDDLSAPSIVQQIVTYILRRHFNITEESITFIGDEYDVTLRVAGGGIVSYNSPPFQQLMNAFQSLERSFQNMEEVPLTIRQLAPASALLRYSALVVPDAVGSVSNPADIVLQFESSARWPDDLKAIQMTKLAFLVKIGDFLQSSGAASSCQVGLENEASPILNNAFLDFAHTSGIVFRLRIHHDREQTLLDRQLKDKSASPRLKEEIAYALHLYKQVLLHRPRLTQAIRTLCTRFPLLSPTIRLVKHWFNSHLFAGHIPEEVIEMLTVRTFTHPFPWETPSSVMVGFLRTLHFISRWDWQQQPLIVDLGSELDDNMLQAIQTRFTAWRKIDPAMNNVALFAASDVDPDGITWTQYGMPPKVVAARLSSMAKAAVKLLRDKGSDLNPTELFSTSLAPYDFVINLSPKIRRDRSTPTVVKFKNLSGRSSKGTNVLSGSTVVTSFIRDLEACFNNSVLLFHGGEQTDIITGLWHPQPLKKKSWSLKLAYSTSPVSLTLGETETQGDEGDDNDVDKDQVIINQSAILNEICRLGEGIIESIDIRKTTVG